MFTRELGRRGGLVDVPMLLIYVFSLPDEFLLRTSVRWKYMVFMGGGLSGRSDSQDYPGKGSQMHFEEDHKEIST